MKKYMRKEEREEKREKPVVYLKRKLMAALSMLLVAAILLTATSYAWLVLSVAPEVTGITTNVGANGSLEIALLNSETYTDLSKIRTGTDSSLAVGSTPNAKANYTWGNLVDLSAADYGLGEILLMPARLNVAQSGDGYKVNSGLLSVPTYGYDGRIIQLTDNTVTTTYSGGSKFTYEGFQDYGVRAVGTTDAVSVQEAALTQAKAAIRTYTESARSAAVAALEDNSDGLITIIADKLGMGIRVGDKGKVETIQSMIGSLKNAVEYIELAIRHGIVAFVASEVANQDTFTTVRDRVMDGSKSLQEVVDGLSEVSALPEGYTTWISGVKEIRNDLAAAENEVANLTEASPWEDLRKALDPLMNTEEIFINGLKFNTLTRDDFQNMLNDGEVRITMASGSGVFADIADYAGDFDTLIEVLMYAVSFTTLTSVNPVYLQLLSDKVGTLEAAGSGSGGALEKFDLTSTFGYALDLAFRCNAANADLLLQTAAIQRVYEDSTAGATMGGGSYMEFSTKDSGFPLAKVIELMDAVRVGFIDDQGNLLGVAKLNTSNRSVEGGVVQAPLFLYDFFFDEEGAMIMGERQKGEGKNIITTLEQNVAKAVSVIVWLDGDIVDNSKVSATQEASLYGMLNLQFATSADLVPAANGDLKNATASKTDLESLIEECRPIYDAGQDNNDGAPYTTLSWTAFTEAYLDAVAVNNDANVDKNQIFYASTNLKAAKEALTQVSHEALRAEITRLRAAMGQTEDVARYVVVDTNGNYVAVDPYTQEQFDEKLPNGDIYRVDYKMNLRDEGNNVFTPIYTDASWSALAAALYDAEALDMDAEATNLELDVAITALIEAEKSLQNKVFFLPYEHSDTLYYMAIPYDPADTDTYGRWYDLNLKRIVADLTILTLDAQAEPATIATIEQARYVSNALPDNGEKSIAPLVVILDELYPSLRDEEIIALQWNVPDGFVEGITPGQRELLTILWDQAVALNLDAGLIADAGKMIELANAVTKADAQEMISQLTNAIGTENEIGPMTEGRAAVLELMIAEAATVEGFVPEENPAPEDGTEPDVGTDDPVNETLIALRAAAAAAAELLQQAERGVYVSNAKAGAALNALNDALVACGKEAFDETAVIEQITPATPEQTAILRYAIDAAMAVEGYADKADLVAAVAAAEAALAETEPKAKMVSEALAALNAALETLEVEPVNEDAITPATSDQLAVLQYAVDTAKSVDGFDGPETANEPSEGDGDAEAEAERQANLAELREAVVAAELILAKDVPVVREVNLAIEALNAALVKNGKPAVDAFGDVVEKRLPATENQLIVLRAAVDSAKSVQNYDDTSKTELNDLRAAVAAAEAILAKVAPNMQETRLATEALNEELVKNGKVAHTEYNTVTYAIPLGSERYELVYAVDRPTTNLCVTGEVADDIITAVVLTRGGVVFTAETNISVYSPAAGVEINEPAALPDGASMAPVMDDEKIASYIWNNDLTMGQTLSLTASLFCRQQPKRGEGGVPVVEDIPLTETISSYSWASSDTEILSVASNSASVCSLTTEGIGTATITLSVMTRQGNTYYSEITLNVKPAAGVKISQVLPEGVTEESSELKNGETLSFAVELVKRLGKKLDADGNVEMDSNGTPVMVEVDHGEAILRTVWLSSDPTIFAVDDGGVATPVANGAATVYVGVITDKGNTYSATYNLTVTGVPEPDPGMEEPTEPTT